MFDLQMWVFGAALILLVLFVRRWQSAFLRRRKYITDGMKSDPLGNREKCQCERNDPLELNVPLETAYKGGFCQISHGISSKCRNCQGGVVEREYGTSVCVECDGSGTVLRNQVVNVPIPKRSGNGTIVSLPCTCGAVNSVMRVSLKIVSQDRFRIHGSDIETDCFISPDLAKCGGLTCIDVPDRTTLPLRIPEGTSDSDRIVLKGAGLKSADGDGFGSIVILIKVALEGVSNVKAKSALDVPRSEDSLRTIDAERRRRQRDFRLNIKK